MKLLFLDRSGSIQGQRSPIQLCNLEITAGNPRHVHAHTHTHTHTHTHSQTQTLHSLSLTLNILAHSITLSLTKVCSFVLFLKQRKTGDYFMYCQHVGNLLIKTTMHTLKWTIGAWMWQSELCNLAFHICYCVLYLKKQRSLAGCVMNCQGGLEVAGVKSGLCM